MRLFSLLASIYGKSKASALEKEILLLIDRFAGKSTDSDSGRLKSSDIFLITYADSVGEEGKKPLETLRKFLDNYAPAITSVHILPFYPYTSDDGFSVLDYKEVNSDHGDWSDIEDLGKEYKLMFDAVINHISRDSKWMQKQLSGDATYQAFVFEDDPDKDWSKVVRPRTSPLFHVFGKKEGKEVNLWTTFSRDQVDLDYRNPKLLLAILEVLLFYVSKGARYLRLDAIGFMWKEEGTTCIHLPQTHQLIKLMRQVISEVDEGVKLITETNVPHQENISYFGNGTDEAHMVYNFTLPPLLAYAILSEDALVFYEWADKLRLPSKEVCFFNFLSSHDGVGVRPVQGILEENQLQILVDSCFTNGGKVSFKTNPDGSQSPYELNCNYFSLLHGKDQDEAMAFNRMILAHAVLLSFPGVPAIYIHSLLGSLNDVKGMEMAGYPRAINREKMNIRDVTSFLEDPQTRQARVHRYILHLVRTRSQMPCLDPYVESSFGVNDGLLTLKRFCSVQEGIFIFNFSRKSLTYQLPDGYWLDELDQKKKRNGQVNLPAHGFLWLSHFD